MSSSNSPSLLISTNSREGEIIYDSLRLYVDITRGKFIEAFDLLPLDLDTEDKRKEWSIIKSVIPQLVSVHTFDDVDGVDKVLEGKSYYQSVDYKVLYARRVMKYIKRKYYHHVVLSDKERAAIVYSLILVCRTMTGNLSSLFESLPFDFHRQYNYEWLKEWFATKEMIGNIVSNFTIENVNGLHTTLSTSHESFQSRGLETLELLERIIKTKRDGGVTALTPA